MGSSWLRNLAGFQLTEEEYRDIPYPRTELLLHVVHRAVQASSVLGAVVVAPIVTLGKGNICPSFHMSILSGPRDLQTLATRCRSYAAYGMIPGLVIGPVIYWGRMRNRSEEEYFDRCYRLRYNKGQVPLFLYPFLISNE
ncbi:unnamed protein product [Echinostoma caproni]|uniref:Complex I-B16.6 n=1 Tax=Echinostoma caproni TaxID=27848 RepID=A0A183BBS7_9TREM|nr:unnamed protein product [Echinostoma caproni]